MGQVADALDDHLTAEEQERREHFKIDGPKTAEWALRKLARARRLQRENKEVADEEARKVTEWLDEVNGTLQRDVDYFEAILTNWHREVLAEDEERKTIKLPAGALHSRKAPNRIEVLDLEAIKTFDPELIRVTVKEDADKKAIKDRIESTGERVPGADLVAGEVSFRVETD